MSGKPKYNVLLTWSETDACYLAMMPAFPYATVHGDTYHEALDAALEAIELIESIRRNKGE